MGRFTVQFSCHHCNHCCKDVVCLPTPFDVIRIVNHTGKDPRSFLQFLTPDQIDGVYNNDPTWLKCGNERYIMALKRNSREGCTFLDKKTRLCSIYEARPLLCRLYPFKVQEDRDGNVKGFTLHSDVGCPKYRDGVMQVGHLRGLYEEDQEHQEDYRELVRVFNRKRYRGKKPSDFIDMFVSTGQLAGKPLTP